MDTRHSPTDYFEIRLKGHLDTRWASWFEGMTIILTEEGDTVLAGPVADQAWVGEVEDGPEVAEAVLDGRAGEGDAGPGVEPDAQQSAE